MSSPNTPSSGNVPSPERISPNDKKGHILFLLDKTLDTCLGGQGENPTEIDPLVFDALKFPEFYAEVREAMKSAVILDGAFRGLSENDIQELSDYDIFHMFEKKVRPLQSARNNLYNDLIRSFPNLKKIPEFSRTLYTKKIQTLSTHELDGYRRNSRTLSSFLNEYFGIPKTKLEFYNFDFEKIFGSTSLQVQNPQLYRELSSAARTFHTTGMQPSFSLLEKLLDFYKDLGDTQIQRQIFSFFHLSLTISDALRVGIIEKDALDDMAQRHYARFLSVPWNELDPNQKKQIVAGLQYDDTYRIDSTYLSDGDIAKFFASPMGILLLTRAVKISIEKQEKPNILAQGILRKLDATRGENGEVQFHQNFLDYIAENRPSLPNIDIFHIQKLLPGSVLVFQDESDRLRYFRLDATDVAMDGGLDYGVTISDITGKQDGTVGSVKSTDTISYDTFLQFLTRLGNFRVLGITEFNQQKTSIPDEKGVGYNHIHRHTDRILDISLSESVHTKEGFIREINQLDPEGEKFGIEGGVYFTANGVTESGVPIEGVWKIESLTDDSVVVSGGIGSPSVRVPFEQFLQVIGESSRNFRRFTKIESENILPLLQAEFGVDSHAHFDGNDLITDDHGHNEHDDDHAHQKRKKYEFFESKNGGHIRIGGFENGKVFFGEYAGKMSLVDAQKRGNAGKLNEKQKDALYVWDTMTYGEFVHYLKKNKFQATTDNLLVPDATDVYHPHAPHLEIHAMSWLGTYWSVADIFKGAQGLMHGVEHYFEKTSKLNASRFALATGRKLHLPADLMAQLQADEVSGVKEIIGKIEDKLRSGLNGPIAREKAIHIAHNRNARPEEVAAAILYMVKGYGLLYAEDIAHYQGSESFINGLIHACGFRGEQITEQKKLAREKGKGLHGGEKGYSISEEEMIWGFMKNMDGKFNEYPVAATLVKAMGGPSAFENAWRKDGFDGAYEKGIRQAGDLSNADARADHGLSALGTNELHTAIGSMEKAADASPAPSVQIIPVLWALGGYSGGAISTKARQKLKMYALGHGKSFHAFGFLQTQNDNLLYRDTFREAIRTLAGDAKVKELDGWIKDLQYDGHTDTKKKARAALQNLASLWRKYADQGLHDMLQGKNTWLIENADKNPRIKEYLAHLSGIHEANSGDEPHKEDNGWYYEMGYWYSPIINTTEMNGDTVISLDRTLRKIRFPERNFEMKKEHTERYWSPAVSMLQRLKMSQAPERLVKNQYCAYRRDILKMLSDKFSAFPEKANVMRKQPYYKDLLAMGIDISLIFQDGDIDKNIVRTAEHEYDIWKKGGYAGANNATGIIPDVKDTVASTIDPSMNATGSGRGGNTFQPGAFGENIAYGTHQATFDSSGAE